MLVVLSSRQQTRMIIYLILTTLLTFTLLPLTNASRGTLERLSRALQALEDMVTEPREPCARCCGGGERRVLTLEELRGDVRGLLRQGLSSRDLLRTVVWELYTMNSASLLQPSFNAYYDEMRTDLAPLDHVSPVKPELQPASVNPRPTTSQGRSPGPSDSSQGSTNCHTLPSQRLEPRRKSAINREIQINELQQAGTRDTQASNNNSSGRHRLSPGDLAITRLRPALGHRPSAGQSKQVTESQVLINHDHQKVRPIFLSPPVAPAIVKVCPPAGDPQVASPRARGVGDRVSARPVGTPNRDCANLSIQATPTGTHHSKNIVTDTTSTRHGSSKEKHILPMMTLWRDAAPSRGVGRLPPKPAPLQVIIIDPMTRNGVPRSYKQHVTLEPSSGIYDILRKASLEYEMKAGNEFKNNPFIFQLGKFRSTCYILKSVMGWAVTTEDYWTITVEDSNRTVLFDDICIPNKHHLLMRPGYRIYLNYSPLPDGRRDVHQSNEGGQHAPAEQ